MAATQPLDLGCFSLSLSVQDLEGNGTTIGIFEKMFEGNIITFNPGLVQDATKQAGDALAAGAQAPDGNQILIDQLF